LRRAVSCSSIGPVPPASAGVIVALGGGITADGEPRPATVARARRAAALYRSGRAQRIVMSGAYGMYDPPPPRAEATAMAQIAVAAGVAVDSIATETIVKVTNTHLAACERDTLPSTHSPSVRQRGSRSGTGRGAAVPPPAVSEPGQLGEGRHDPYLT
jgi:DUF218 domain